MEVLSRVRRRSGPLPSFFFLFLLPLSVDSRLHRPRDFICRRLIIFGDSLSDDGVEADGPSHGFERNSNGPVWPEYLNRLLNCEQFLNYAYSGAKSGVDNFYFKSGGSIDFFTGEKDATVVLGNTRRAVERLVQLMDSGSLVVLNLLDQGNAPGIRAAEQSDELQKRISDLVSEANRQLVHLLYDPELGMHSLSKNVKVMSVDLNSLVLRTMSKMNVTEPYTHHKEDTRPKTITGYAYHDLWHPSTFVHFKVAKEIARELQDAA